MSTGIRAYIEQQSPVIDRALRSKLPISKLGGAQCLNDAVSYAVFSGGKRMRPILALLAAEICGAPAALALPVACAVEFLHTASLTLDDLPPMDDAGLRRGRAAAHILFGQDMAILASLALLNEAYVIFAEVPGLLPCAFREIGVNGMIGGQAADLRATRSHSRMEKTTALARLTMAAGAMVAGARAAETDALVSFGHALGEAYQISDDVADVLGSEPDMGKSTGQDQRHGRSSALVELGIGGAWEYARELIDRAGGRLRDCFGNVAQAELLEDFARSVVSRGFEAAVK
ncbi:MAG: polyprenyl synthetase family protein [Bryobacteraceae bacterium]